MSNIAKREMEYAQFELVEAEKLKKKLLGLGIEDENFYLKEQGIGLGYQNYVLKEENKSLKDKLKKRMNS